MMDSGAKNNMTFSKKINVLLVDDSILVYKLVEKYLKDSNYNLLYAKNAKEAFDIMDFIKPDLILLDILLPDINGYHFLERIGKNPDICNIPVVMISGLDKKEDISKAFRLGAQNYILKPFNSTELSAKIDYVIQKKQVLHA